MRPLAAIAMSYCLAVVSSQATIDDQLTDSSQPQTQGSDVKIDEFTDEMCRKMDPCKVNNRVEGHIEDQDIDGRKAISCGDRYWPDGEIPYEYDESFETSPSGRDWIGHIEAAMTQWASGTCISFRERQGDDESFLIFRLDSLICGTQLGVRTWNFTGQYVLLADHCMSTDGASHEIGHAMGLFHEMNRSDRDEHIKIMTANLDIETLPQFCPAKDTNYSVPYDLTSVLHYEDSIASIDKYGTKSIVTENPFYQRFLFKQNPISFRDRLLANRMYNCIDETSNACKNGGYMRRTTLGHSAGTYSCDCPPNTKGEFCEDKLREDYYEELPCGGNVTREGFIETPGYPKRTQVNMDCAWNITAPAGHRVELTIEGFNFVPLDRRESVEFRLNSTFDRYTGKFYGGTDRMPGKVLKSNGTSAVIIVRARHELNGSGFKAKVRFAPVLGS